MILIFFRTQKRVIHTWQLPAKLRCLHFRRRTAMKCLGGFREHISRWWFPIYFNFDPVPWGNDRIWLIFGKWVEKTTSTSQVVQLLVRFSVINSMDGNFWTLSMGEMRKFLWEMCVWILPNPSLHRNHNVYSRGHQSSGSHFEMDGSLILTTSQVNKWPSSPLCLVTVFTVSLVTRRDFSDSSKLGRIVKQVVLSMLMEACHLPMGQKWGYHERARDAQSVFVWDDLGRINKKGWRLGESPLKLESFAVWGDFVSCMISILVCIYILYIEMLLSDKTSCTLLKNDYRNGLHVPWRAPSLVIHGVK